MSTCWYCHWGWPRAVALIYKDALEQLDGYTDPLHFGPSHVVWEDENFDLAECCLKDFDKRAALLDYSQQEMATVKRSLEKLAKIPLNSREVEPDDYDGIDPRKYPPKVEMIHPRDIRRELREKRDTKRGFIVVSAK